MAISRAMTAGGRKGVMSTLGPNLRRRVRAATAAMVVMGSGTGRGEDRRSENHTESMAVRSHTSMKRQRKSRPSGPAGHTPGITPIRYLVSMAATVARPPRPQVCWAACSLRPRRALRRPRRREIRAGRGGLTRAVVTTPAATAHVYLHGAHVTHFQPASSAPVLFISPRSAFAAGRAIRGGVPVIFPWFGPHPDDPRAPDHGFARTADGPWSPWRRRGCGLAGLALEASDATRAAWPHAFRLRYRVTVGRPRPRPDRGESLVVGVRLPGGAPHVSSRGRRGGGGVHGLEDTAYIDKADGMARKRQGREPVRLRGLTDRVYLDTGPLRGRRPRAGAEARDRQAGLAHHGALESGRRWRGPWRISARGVALHDVRGDGERRRQRGALAPAIATR